MFYQNEKIETDIIGLDRLLYGGIQLQETESISKKRENGTTTVGNAGNDTVTAHQGSPRPLKVVVLGQGGTFRSLLGMQLLHGLTKSLLKLRALEKCEERKDCELGEPIFLSYHKHKENLEDMLLDMAISKCVQKIIKNNVESNTKWVGDNFSQTVFDYEQGKAIGSFSFSEMDKYIGEEVVVYNNRTNALHFSAPYEPGIEKKSFSDNSNLIAKRQYEHLGSYKKHNLPDELACEFFDVKIWSCGTKQVNEDIEKNEYLEKAKLNNNFYIPCLVVDDYSKMSKKDKELAKHSLITIYLERKSKRIRSLDPELQIELRTYEDNEIEYWINQMTVRKASLQSAAIGWHQYKKRDYGIEVFPSTHVLLQRRRHMPRAILRTHTDILTDTFQQYLDSIMPAKTGERKVVSETKHKTQKSIHTSCAVIDAYEEYQEKVSEISSERLQKTYDTLKDDLHTGSVMENILVKNPFGRGLTTVIIGAPNSYKRFLSLAKTFSASFSKMSTLYVLLDQNSERMRRSMVCPTWEYRYSTSGKPLKQFSSQSDTNDDVRNPNCRDCYSYIHFWDLRMGNIPSDEFFYYFVQQIEALKGISQVVIDNIQKIEYSFPLLKRDKLFLTTLVSICKDYKIDLVVLCDRSSDYLNELRSLADNVICAERYEKEARFYIEQYAGYNAPSHIFACKVKKMEELFYCESLKNVSLYRLNENRIEDINVANMDDYWIDNNTKSIVGAIKKR